MVKNELYVEKNSGIVMSCVQNMEQWNGILSKYFMKMFIILST